MCLRSNKKEGRRGERGKNWVYLVGESEGKERLSRMKREKREGGGLAPSYPKGNQTRTFGSR